MALTKKHLETFCNPSDPYRKCRYLEFSNGVHVCLKKSPQKELIDDEFYRVMVKNKNTEHFAMGDNCDGYLVFYNIEQGYDVDKKP